MSQAIAIAEERSFRAICSLGRGGMAQVFVAEQTGPGSQRRIVAVKRVHSHFAQSEEYQQMFRREARLATLLDHRNVVRVFEMGGRPGAYFIVMEYLPGEDLRSVQRRLEARAEHMPCDLVAYVALEAAEALSYVHQVSGNGGESLGLVHRDVNPSNLLVTYQGITKLLDFGIAKVNTETSMTSAGVFKGKLAYASPEQVNSQRLDGRSDVFALGIVMWELLMGRRLFRRRDPAATFEAVRAAPIPVPSAVDSRIPSALSAIVMRALTREVDGRYQSAEELRDDLHAFLSAQSMTPGPDRLSGWLRALFGEERARQRLELAAGKPPLSMASGSRSSAPRLETGDSSFRPLTEELSELPGGEVEVPERAPPSNLERAKPSNLELAPRAPDPQGRRQPSLLPLLAWLLVITATLLAMRVDWGRVGQSVQDERPISLKVSSEPRGSQLFIHGEPTGRKTPTEIAAWPGEPLEISLQKPGYAPFVQTVRPADGFDATFRLLPEESGVDRARP